MIIGPAWGGSVEDDAGMHALETDVMRFMAILAFCLLAIFALVQSVPWSPEVENVADNPAAAEIPAAPADQPVQPQPHQIAVTVPAAIAPPPVVVGKRDTPRSLPAAQMQKELLTPVAEVPELAEAVVSAMAAAVTVDNTAKSAGAVEARSATDIALGSARPPLRDVPVDAAAQPDRDVENDSSLPPGMDPQAGFTLRFASDAAMFGLIESGAVSLYALAESAAWRLAASSGRYSFHASAPPQQIYEMTPATVPSDLLRALRRRVNVAVDSVSWGVVLPPSTGAAITAAMHDADGGQLSIQADGRVRLE